MADFTQSVREEEKKIRDAKNRLRQLEQEAIDRWCPAKIGDPFPVNQGNGIGQPMTVTKISIIAPMIDGAPWRFLIDGLLDTPAGVTAVFSVISFPNQEEK